MRVEALLDLALAHIVFGLNCAALEILNKVHVLLEGSRSRTSRFLQFCYGMVYYYFNRDADRGLTRLDSGAISSYWNLLIALESEIIYSSI